MITEEPSEVRPLFNPGDLSKGLHERMEHHSLTVLQLDCYVWSFSL